MRKGNGGWGRGTMHCHPERKRGIWTIARETCLALIESRRTFGRDPSFRSDTRATMRASTRFPRPLIPHPPLPRKTRHNSRNRAVLSSDDISERIQISLQLRDVVLQTTNLVGGIVERVCDGRLAARVATRGSEECDAQEQE